VINLQPPTRRPTTCPSALALKLAGLKTGTTRFTVKLSYKETKTKRGRKTTVTVTKTLKGKFLVC